jgi:hypothetical protein
MSLDMTGEGRHDRRGHYRRYLSDRHQRIIVICVQDFDYIDYEPHRFVDLQMLDSEEEGRLMPLRPQDVLDQMELLDEDDELGRLQGHRLLRAIERELLDSTL